MITFLKKAYSIVRDYEKNRKADQKFALSLIQNLESIIRDRTEIHADVSFARESNKIILIGAYRGKDYIQTYSLPAGDFESLLHFLKEQQRYGKIGRIDTIPLFKSVIEKEII